MFDASSFLQETVDQPMETDRRMVPAADYQAMIGDFDEKAVQRYDFTYKQGPKAGQPGSMTKLNLPFVITDPKATQAIGFDSATVYWDIILDVDANGKLEFGPNKNIDLGKVREAVGQNAPGPWGPSMLRNAGPCMVKVVHEPFTRRDGSKGTAARVVRAVKIV